MNTQTILSDAELAPLLERKRQLQAHLASQSSGASTACGTSQSRCSSSATPSSATAQPNVLKALLIAVSVLTVSALVWWGVTG